MLQKEENSAPSQENGDMIAIATAFRNASDEDIRGVLNAMSNDEQLRDLFFYVVPRVWFQQALPVLKMEAQIQPGEDWRERVGRIGNEQLLQETATVSSDDEETTRTNSTKNSSKDGRLKQDASHEDDYCLLGSNAWQLVSEKFGYDVELRRSCIRLQDGALAVQVDKDGYNHRTTSVPIPASGRFAYESSILQKNQQEALPQREHAATVVSSSQGNGEEAKPRTRSSHKKRMTPHPAAEVIAANLKKKQSAAATDVVSDEGSDMFPSPGDGNDRGDAASEPQHDDPILRLPPSQTDANEDRDKLVAVSTKRKRYGSGLGNLGNTCFMNSTLQCLAHTQRLRRYFLSGEYERDLNKDNPLGTGGELATQFAELLGEMFLGRGNSHVIYPRNFKYTLGKHAEQFLGYDQHDSQELATYLLDALHEDTNRVTKKPYIEKPEQADNEPDEVAAEKAWSLHLQREDSQVLENFMGQVKSRVQCSTEGCGRVSTTFDPFMFLSVPIPGATDRTLKVTFVPLDPQERMKNMSITLSKTATISTLLKKMNEQLVKIYKGSEPIPLDDLCAVDVWLNEVYSWYGMNDEIDKIQDRDFTYIYELDPVSKFQEDDSDIERSELSLQEVRTKNRSDRFRLSVTTMTELNRDEKWMTTLEQYVVQPMYLYNIFNPNRGSIEECVRFFKKMESFVEDCHKSLEVDSTGIKRAHEDSAAASEENEDGENDGYTETSGDLDLPGLVEVSESSQTFRGVRTRKDLAVMEFCSNKLRSFILRAIQNKKKKDKDGAVVQIIMRKNPAVSASHFNSKDKKLGHPLVLRVPHYLTVYGLRQVSSERLVRSLKTGQPAESLGNCGSGESSAEQPGATALHRISSLESNVDRMEGDPSEETSERHLAQSSMDIEGINKASSSPELLILRQIPLTFERKSSYSYTRGGLAQSKKLGTLERSETTASDVYSLACIADEEEQHLISEAVGERGSVYLEWPQQLCDNGFDVDEYEASEDIKPDTDEDAVAVRTRQASKTTTVLDCIEKYCQMEQLEETEMWYCNRCKKHVRAWKQFHIYRAPPILIVHLKRFYFSASSHRRDKIDSFIDFPLHGLDLTGLVMHWGEDEKPIYDCYAVSNHYGGLGGGHYTAYAQGDDGTWCHFDDSRLTTDVDPKDVVSAAAYVLYYRRMDVPLGEDFFDSAPTPAIVQDHHNDGKDDRIIKRPASSRVAEDMEVDETDASSRATSTAMGSIGVEDELPDGEYENGQNSSNTTASNDFPPQ